MSLYLTLFHGRATPDQDMEHWGDAGPAIGPLSYVHTTYGSEVKVRGAKSVLERFFPQAEIHFHDGFGEHAIQLADDCLPHDGKFYGDWSVCTADALQPRAAKPVVPVCDVCGSADLVKDAAAVWDRDRQEWSLLSTYDSTTCQGCEREGDTIARWIPSDQAPPLPDVDLAGDYNTQLRSGLAELGYATRVTGQNGQFEVIAPSGSARSPAQP